MKKSEFIEKVLKHKLNTIFVHPEQVERAIKIFEELGMAPPKILYKGKFIFKWEENEKK